MSDEIKIAVMVLVLCILAMGAGYGCSVRAMQCRERAYETCVKSEGHDCMTTAALVCTSQVQR